MSGVKWETIGFLFGLGFALPFFRRGMAVVSGGGWAVSRRGGKSACGLLVVLFELGGAFGDLEHAHGEPSDARGQFGEDARRLVVGLFVRSSG